MPRSFSSNSDFFVSWPCVVSAIIFVLATPSSIEASPIPLSPGSVDYYDFSVEVVESITVVPGEVSFIPARLWNVGTVSASFKQYDSTNPIGGFGYDFYTPGLSLSGGISAALLPGANSTWISIEQGEVSTLFFSPSSFTNFDPNWSHLNGLTIAPGDFLDFTITTVAVNATQPLGLVDRLAGSLSLYLGEPIYKGMETGALAFEVLVYAGATAVSGPLQQVQLQNFEFEPRTNDVGSGTSVPESSTALLFSLGLCAAIGAFTWRSKSG